MAVGLVAYLSLYVVPNISGDISRLALLPFGHEYERNIGKSDFYGHLGIYGYKREALIKMTELPQTTYEMAESLEQLRALKILKR